MIWPFSRIRELEKRLDEERERHRRREDALLNRILAKNRLLPITEDELYPENVAENGQTELIDQEIEQKLADFKANVFDEWAQDAHISDAERERQWRIYKSEHLDEILGL